jgi:hypothetical protein
MCRAAAGDSDDLGSANSITVNDSKDITDGLSNNPRISSKSKCLRVTERCPDSEVTCIKKQSIELDDRDVG